MKNKWNSHEPITVQLFDIFVEKILSHEYREGSSIPSVRSTAEQYGVSALTASKVHQALSELNVLEKKRGIGLFVRSGGRSILLKRERKKFFDSEWPKLMKRISMLELEIDALQHDLEGSEDEEEYL